MTINEYASVIFENKLYEETAFMKRIFSLPTNSKYFKVDDNGDVYDNITGEKLDFIRKDLGVMDTNTPVEVNVCGEKRKTRIGTAILNQLIHDATDGKLPYYEEQFDLGKPLNEEILPNLGKGYTLMDYKRFARVSAYIRMFVSEIVTSATLESITIPKGMKAFKDKLAKKFTAEDKDWKNNPTKVMQYDNECMVFLKNSLKDDPTYGIVTSGKTLNVSMKKRFVSVGTGTTPDPIGKPLTIMTSLAEGMPLKKDVIAASNNTTRDGSASRGIETRDGGVQFKAVVEATHAIKINVNDCKSTDYYSVKVNAKSVNGLVGMYTDKGKELTYNDVINSIGKVIKIRFPMGCKAKGEVRCKVCCGTSLGSNVGGIPLMAIKVGSLGVLASLAKFHAGKAELYRVSADTLLE